MTIAQSTSRAARRTAFGATIAMAAVGLAALPAHAAALGTVTPATPTAGSSFTVTATGLATGATYKVLLTSSTTFSDVTDVAEANDCEAGKAAPAASMTCTLTENTGGDYVLKLLGPDGYIGQQAVTVNTVTATPPAPTINDAPGTASDTVTVTKTAGINWTVDGTPVEFGANETTKAVNVGADGVAQVKATAADGYVLPRDAQSTWDYVFSTNDAPLGTVSVPTPVGNDAPGTSADTVTLTKVDNVTWSVNGTVVDFGASTTATVKVATGKPAEVVATAAPGYMFAGNLPYKTFWVNLSDNRAEPTTVRLAGDNRMDTAVEVSKKYFASAGTVYVANGWRYPDALTAGPAAAKDDGPLLLSLKDSVPSNVLDEIRRLNPARIHVVGGPAVVSDGVVKTLDGIAPTTRLAGATRYETAAKVSEKWNSSAVVYLALGENFPDALTGGSGAAKEGAPLLLSTKTDLTQPTIDALRRLNPGTKVKLVGGSDVLSNAVMLRAKEVAPAAEMVRYAGADRYATGVEVAKHVTATNPASVATIFLATGLNYPDALAGVPAAHKANAPLLLSQPNCLPPSVSALEKTMTGLKTVVRLGSSAVLGDFSMGTVCSQ